MTLWRRQGGQWHSGEDREDTDTLEKIMEDRQDNKQEENMKNIPKDTLMYTFQKKKIQVIFGALHGVHCVFHPCDL